MRLLPSLMADFRSRNPSVTMTLYSGTKEEIVGRMLAGDVEVAVLTTPSNFMKGLTVEPFRLERFSAFVPCGHPLAHKVISARQFAKLPLIVRIGRTGEHRIEELLTAVIQLGLKPQIAMGCESPDAVKSAVRRGGGVGILYHDAIEDNVSRKEFTTLELDGIGLTAWSYIVHHEWIRPNSLAHRFLGLLHKSMESTGADCRGGIWPPLRGSGTKRPNEYGRRAHRRDRLPYGRFSIKRSDRGFLAE
jgi:DNA-binding transcriptional LysR family regulator